ncbi:MAG: 16S rRNA (cytosine(1402)-N(4))-methyltransferase RsmH [Paludibacter sp.]|jgi:16S rRNA (cytosine1402-N4)-methyltransferase|nr:16S rRNA (cytosine(1402)-N(4))-methyltransferase RsmH [Paludibacter sp.]
MNYHIPALLEPTINGLNIKADGIYVDATFGGGGHSRKILSHLSNEGRLLGFDHDSDATTNTIDDSKFTFVRGNFRYIKNFLRYHKIDAVDGILADLGVSFYHFDTAERGFSFRHDAMLDMRMNQNASLTAEILLNTYQEEKLADIFKNYGEMYDARKIAAAITKARSNKKISTINDFLQIMQPFTRYDHEKKELSKAFQAIRIEVNGELDALKELLLQSTQVLKKNGRIAIISYHSLEDRLVKNYFKTGNFEGKQEKNFFGECITPLKTVNNKVIVPSEEEITENPRSRSAKLRIAEKV